MPSGTTIPHDIAALPFHTVDGTLHCEGVDVAGVAKECGTPVYIYSSSAIATAYYELANALSGTSSRIHFSVKACSNLAILNLLRGLGSAVDVVSGGELERALDVGFPPDDIVFGGVGKSDMELAYAVRLGLKSINVESEGELERLSQIAVAANAECRVLLRVNPEVTVETPHPYISTGTRGMKFGIPHDRVAAAAATALRLPGIQLVGLDFHIGSQISDPAPYAAAVRRVVELVALLRGMGASDIRYLDVGGGLGVQYDHEEVLSAAGFAAMVVPVAERIGVELIVEPGRFLLANSAILLATVLDLKHSGGKDFMIVDAGMNDLIRPSHYNSFHRISTVVDGQPDASTLMDVVGPVCESGDFLGLNRALSHAEVGDLIAVHSAGAYGFCMSSNYNSRVRPAEVLVNGDRFAVIRTRETYQDLVRNEIKHPNWKREG